MRTKNSGGHISNAVEGQAFKCQNSPGRKRLKVVFRKNPPTGKLRQRLEALRVPLSNRNSASESHIRTEDRVRPSKQGHTRQRQVQSDSTLVLTVLVSMSIELFAAKRNIFGLVPKFLRILRRETPPEKDFATNCFLIEASSFNLFCFQCAADLCVLQRSLFEQITVLRRLKKIQFAVEKCAISDTPCDGFPG